MRRHFMLQLASLCALSISSLQAANKRMHISTLLAVDPATIIAERILTEAYGRLNLDIIVDKFPGERSLRNANDGETDGELYRKQGMEREYPNLLIVPVPLLTYEIVVFSRGTEFNVQNWDSLRPFSIGFVKGIKVVEQNTVGMRIEPAPTLGQAFQKMMLGRSDIVVANRLSGLFALKELNNTEIKVLKPPLVSFPVYHYLHHKHAALLPRLQAVLSQMQKEKRIEKIQAEVIAEMQ
jgi:polar amino acid transport system substrate-binding protein